MDKKRNKDWLTAAKKYTPVTLHCSCSQETETSKTLELCNKTDVFNWENFCSFSSIKKDLKFSQGKKK